ncbi:MAG: nitroreductase [Saprospiraceae bacterium]|nr:nitroreductase [Saprospiraceae bacterium]
MNSKFSTLTELITTRKSEFPSTYKSGNIDPQLIDELISNALWAPNHKKTEPWRFVVIQGEKKKELSDFMAGHYQKTTAPDQFDPLKQRKASEKPLQSAAVIAICIHRSPEALIPSWEETAAVACAVQNLWLGCTAVGIGAYWSTPGIIKHLNAFLKLQEQEECIGLFYMGWSGNPGVERTRKSLDQVRRWL